MFRLVFFLFIALLSSCKQNNRSKSADQSDNIKKEARDAFKGFDSTIEIRFWQASDSISEMVQKKNCEGLLSKLNLLTPEILKTIFEFYKDMYPAYKRGWTLRGLSRQELEKYLPTPTTPENLKAFITPTVIHIPNTESCKEGTIGIEFDCTWDNENGLGVIIKDWKVTNANVAKIVDYLGS
jgi:hypothetical protein